MRLSQPFKPWPPYERIRADDGGGENGAEIMREIIIYGIVGISSLILLAYTVHMFVGGLVSKEVEQAIMAVVVLIGALAMGLMAWDVVKRRRAAGEQRD